MSKRKQNKEIFEEALSNISRTIKALLEMRRVIATAESREIASECWLKAEEALKALANLEVFLRSFLNQNRS